MTEDEWLTLINARNVTEWDAAMKALKEARGGYYPNEISTHSRMFNALYEKIPQGHSTCPSCRKEGTIAMQCLVCGFCE